jgi:hypothetical protein
MEIIDPSFPEVKLMKNSAKIMLLLLVCLLSSVSLVSANAVFVIPDTGNGITPIIVAGNPTCSDVGCPGTEFKIDIGSGVDYSGTYYLDAANTQWIKITAYKAAGSDEFNSIDWTSNVQMNCVIMKGGSEGANEYCYGPGVTSDTSLFTPLTGNSGKPAGISHIVLCYTPGIYPPPPPVPEFPTIVFPVALIIGMLGSVLFIQRTREN